MATRKPKPPATAPAPEGDGTSLAAVAAVQLSTGLPKPKALQGYAITTVDPNYLGEVMAENFGKEKVDPFDLTRIRIPSAGGLAWTVPTMDGPKAFEVVEGVIVGHNLQRAYWAESFAATGGGSPPDCSSLDAEIGQGDPGGVCKDCPFAQFGSAIGDDGEMGDGQACRLVRIVYVMRPNSLIPTVIPVPPSSLKVMKAYLMQLSENGLQASGVITRFGLSQDKSKKRGITYSKVKPTLGAVLTREEWAAYMVPVRTHVTKLTQIVNVKDYAPIA